jgi:hypothetical protein
MILVIYETTSSSVSVMCVPCVFLLKAHALISNPTDRESTASGYLASKLHPTRSAVDGTGGGISSHVGFCKCLDRR